MGGILRVALGSVELLREGAVNPVGVRRRALRVTGSLRTRSRPAVLGEGLRVGVPPSRRGQRGGRLTKDEAQRAPRCVRQRRRSAGPRYERRYTIV